MAATQPDQTYPDLLSYQEAAAALNLTAQGIKAAIAQGRLHPVKLAGTQRKFIRREEIASYEARKYNRQELAAARSAGVAAPDEERMRSMVAALSGPTLDAFRETLATAQKGIESLAYIAGAVALGASGGQTPDPKRLAG